MPLSDQPGLLATAIDQSSKHQPLLPKGAAAALPICRAPGCVQDWPCVIRRHAEQVLTFYGRNPAAFDDPVPPPPPRLPTRRAAVAGQLEQGSAKRRRHRHEQPNQPPVNELSGGSAATAGRVMDESRLPASVSVRWVGQPDGRLAAPQEWRGALP
ncbi:hypothetical protein [Fodinicola feengrottensis]|uniref:Uncharacterized protein n=1 Tax=Fodinicola feengrottensis TaxID=435914 RepID=A0ABN2IDC5_9ACTN|nr:hypothetical protein [Fodinicola feengrottensis]